MASPGIFGIFGGSSSSSSGGSSGSGNSGSGSPCGACKFLRRKCARDCVFAPYFCTEQGPARFAAIHKVFGASNVSKLLLHIPVADRCEAVFTIAYEAQARIHDPVYGCVSHIFALQQHVAFLQAQLMQLKAQLAHQNNNAAAATTDLRNSSTENQLFWQANGINFPNRTPSNHPYCNNINPNPSSPESSLESVDYSHHRENNNIQQEYQSRGVDYDSVMFSTEACGSNKRRAYCSSDLSELQALAIRMVRRN